MYRYRIVLIIVFSFFLFADEFLYGWSPPTEIYAIVNDTDKEIKFDIKFKEFIGYHPRIGYYENDILVSNIDVFSMAASTIYIIPPNDFYSIVDFIKNIRVGVMKKIELVIQDLTIYDSDEKIIFTLDDLDKYPFVTDEGNMTDNFTMTAHCLYITEEIIEAGRKKYANVE